MISSLPGSALRTHVELLDKPHDSTSVLKVLSHAIQQAFSKPCLVNLVSKDTQLVFCLYDCRLDECQELGPMSNDICSLFVMDGTGDQTDLVDQLVQEPYTPGKRSVRNIVETDRRKR